MNGWMDEVEKGLDGDMRQTLAGLWSMRLKRWERRDRGFLCPLKLKSQSNFLNGWTNILAKHILHNESFVLKSTLFLLDSSVLADNEFTGSLINPQLNDL